MSIEMRRFTTEDLPFLNRLHADPEVVKFLGQGAVRNELENAAWLRRTIGNYAQGVGQMMVLRDGEPVGRCGANPCWIARGPVPEVYFEEVDAPVDAVRALELGYTLLRSEWGQGLATEAATRMLARLPRNDLIVSLVHVDHAASMRVSSKLQFHPWQLARYHGRPMWLMRSEQ